MISKKESKSFGVECPQDFETNENWKEFIKLISEIDNYKYCGESISWFYGKRKDNAMCANKNENDFDEILTIEEAIEYITGESKSQPKPHKEPMKLGFKREDIPDSVVHDQTGQYPFYLTYKLGKFASYVIYSDNLKQVKIQVTDKDGNIKASHVVPFEDMAKQIEK